MSQKLTRRGARELTATIDRIASVIQENPSILGIDTRIAKDYAYRCDLISDAIEKMAVENFPLDRTAAEDEEGMSIEPTGGFDPNAIGDVTGGPLEIIEPPSEPWMDDHFTGMELHQLGELQESGSLAAGAAAAAKFASLLAQAEARLSKLAAIPSVTVQGPAGFAEFIRELDGLANKSASAKAAIEAAIPKEFLDAKELADKEYGKAQRVLKEQIVGSYAETTNVIIQRKTKLVQVSATIQVQQKQIKGLLGLGRQNSAQEAMLDALVAEYGEAIRGFIAKTASALSETHQETALVIKGWEMEHRAGKTAGLLDQLTKFQEFISRSWKNLVRKFQNLVGIISQSSKEVDAVETRLLKELKGRTKAASAPEKAGKFAGFNLLD